MKNFQPSSHAVPRVTEDMQRQARENFGAQKFAKHLEDPKYGFKKADLLGAMDDFLKAQGVDSGRGR